MSGREPSSPPSSREAGPPLHRQRRLLAPSSSQQEAPRGALRGDRLVSSDNAANETHGEGKLIYDLEVKKKNKTIRFDILEFFHPSSHYAINISSGTSGAAEQQLTIIVTKTEDFHELYRIWKHISSDATAVHNKTAKRLITCTKLEFDQGKISRVTFDSDAFSHKNRSDINSLLNVMATRIQALARCYIVRQRITDSQRPATLPLLGNHAEDHNNNNFSRLRSPRSRNRKRKKKKKVFSDVRAKNEHHQKNRTSKSQGYQEGYTTAQRTLFSSDSHFGEDELLHNQSQRFEDDHKHSDWDNYNFYEYEYPLNRSTHSPSKQSSPRSKFSSSEPVSQSTPAAGSPNAQNQSKTVRRPVTVQRVRTAEREEYFRNKKDRIAGAYFPPVEKSDADNQSVRQQLLLEIQSIKKEVSVALQSFQVEMDMVKSNLGEEGSIVRDPSTTSPVRHMVHEGGMLEDASVLHVDGYSNQDSGSVIQVIKNQSSMITESVDGMRHELLSAREEIATLRSQIAEKSNQYHDEEENHSGKRSEEKEVSMSPSQQNLIFDDSHCHAAIRIQNKQRQRAQKKAFISNVVRVIKEVRGGLENVSVRESILLALKSGNVELARIVMRRSFETFQDTKSLTGFSLYHESNISLVCELVEAFVSVEEVASFGVQLLSLVSLLPNFKNCQGVLGSAGACDLTISVLSRHVENNSICVQALMLALCLVNDCPWNCRQLTIPNYCSIYGKLLSKNHQNEGEVLVVEKTIRLLSKLTAGAPDIVARFNDESQYICDELVNGLHRSLRTSQFVSYCKLIGNLCSHNNAFMRQALGSRRYSHLYIECLNACKSDTRSFKNVVNIVILISGDVSNDDFFDGIITEYFVSAVVGMLKDSSHMSPDVIEILVIMLHKMSSSSLFLDALRELRVDKILLDISNTSFHLSSVLSVKINLLLSLLDKAGTENSSNWKVTAIKPTVNNLLPKKKILQSVHDCFEIKELMHFLKLSISEGRDSIALQTIICITTLVADKNNNADLANFLLDDIQPIMVVLQAFTAISEVQVVGINLLQLLMIDYRGQITNEDTIKLVKTVTGVVWGHFSSEPICEKYLDFVLLCTSGDDNIDDVRNFAANAETFVAVKNMMTCHIIHEDVILKCCDYVAQLSISNSVRSMILASGFNDSFVEYMHSCAKFDEKTASVFHRTIISLCADRTSEDQMLFFSNHECSSLYLHLLQTCERSGRIWIHVLKVILFMAESTVEEHRRGIRTVNYAAAISRGLHSFDPTIEFSVLLVENIAVFLMGILSCAPMLERRFINVDTANFVTAIASDKMEGQLLFSIMTQDACKVIKRLLHTVPIEVAVQDLIFYFLEQIRQSKVSRDVASKLLQRNLRRLHDLRNANKEVQYCYDHMYEKSDSDFVLYCLNKAIERGSISLAEAMLDRINDFLDLWVEAEDSKRQEDLASVTQLSLAPGIILETMSNFLSVASIQYLALRTLRHLPYKENNAEALASKDIKPCVDTFFFCLLRHINDNVLCGETLDCLIFLTTLSEVNIYSASTPVGFQVISFLLKNRHSDIFIMIKLCQFVSNMCKNITNVVVFGEYKVTNYIFHFLASNMHANDVVNYATQAISSLCSDGTEDNMHVLASSGCLKMYYSILRRNPRNVELHINVGKMILSFTSGNRKATLMRQEFTRSRLSEELQTLLRAAIKTNHQGVASCLVALTVHFICYQQYLQQDFIDAGINFTLLEYMKPEWNSVLRSIAEGGLGSLGETRHKGTFLSKILKKKDTEFEMNFFKNIVRIRSETLQAAVLKKTPSRAMKEKTLQREQHMVDSLSMKKALSSAEIERGSWLNIIPSEEQAATTINRAARAFISKKAAAEAREEEEKRLPLLKQLAEVSTDADVLLECLLHCSKWGRVDLALVVTRRIFILKTSEDMDANHELIGLFYKLTNEPNILIDILTTFGSMQLVQRQVLIFLQQLPFDEKHVNLLADMGTCDIILAIALRHPSNTQLSEDCIKTLAYFSKISFRYRCLICEDGPLKILVHLIDKNKDVRDMLHHCFVLVSNVCKDAPDNQSMFAETKLSFHVLKYGERNLEVIDSLLLVCNVVKSLCEDGDLSNMEQYFSREYLVLYHGMIGKNFTNKIVVRQVYFLLMLAARCSGPYAEYFSKEVAHSDAPDFLVHIMLPEEKNRSSQALFYLLLIITCTYLRAAPSIIPTVLKSNMAGIMTQYLDPFWNNEVQKSTKYCLRLLNAWTKIHDGAAIDHTISGDSSLSLAGSSLQLGSAAFDDSVSVLTQDASDFQNKRDSNASFLPTNSFLTNNQHSVDEGGLDGHLSLSSKVNANVVSSGSKVERSNESLEEAFAILQRTIDIRAHNRSADSVSENDERTQQFHVLATLNDIADHFQVIDMPSYIQNIHDKNSGQSLVREVFPCTLKAVMSAFTSNTDIQLAVCKVWESLPYDSISSDTINFGMLMSISLEQGIKDEVFCLKMLKNCVHFASVSSVIKNQLVSKESLSVILSVMRHYTEDLDLMKVFLRYVFQMCCDNADAQTLLSVEGIGAILLKSLIANHTNRDMVSLISKAIVTLCMNKNLANIYDFGSFKNMQTYFFIIKANCQDEHICSSMSFLVLGVLTIGKDIILDSLRMQPFALELKEVLSESSFSTDAAEVIVLLTSKVICNFSQLLSGFIHVNIAAELKLFSVGHWNDTTRNLAIKTLRKLKEMGEIQVTENSEEGAHMIITSVSGDKSVLSLDDKNNRSSRSVVHSISVVEAQTRIQKFVKGHFSRMRTRARSTHIQEVDVSNIKMPINDILDAVVLKGRIHLAVGIMKKVLVAVQSCNDKTSGLAAEISSNPQSLIGLMYAFMSIEAVPRDGLLILRGLNYTTADMTLVDELSIFKLMYEIIRRYEHSSLHNICISALKTISFFAKNNVHNIQTTSEEVLLGLFFIIQTHRNDKIFMLEACITLTDLCNECSANKDILSTSSLNDIAVDILENYKQEKECIHTVGNMIKVLCTEADVILVKKFGERQCLTVLYQILKDNVENREICTLYCTLLTLLVGSDVNYCLAELTSCGASSTLSDILRNESTYRPNPEVLSPIFTLMVHYVYNIPYFTLDLYQTDIPVALETFCSVDAWAESRKAASIILSKIKVDMKQVEAGRKKTVRQAQKQKSQKKLQRQTSLPRSGINDWTDLSALFALLREGFSINNDDDVMEICQRIVSVCRDFDDITRHDRALFNVFSKEYLPILVEVIEGFRTEKSIVLLVLGIMEYLPFNDITPQIFDLGALFAQILETHVEDMSMSKLLINRLENFASNNSFIRLQFAEKQSVDTISRLMTEYGKRDVELIESCLSFIATLCGNSADRSKVQSTLCNAGMSKAIISLLIDHMDNGRVVDMLVQVILVLCSGENKENIGVFASASSFKLYLHIAKSNPTSGSISTSMCSLLTSFLHTLSLQGQFSDLVSRLSASSFIIEFRGLLLDQLSPRNTFDPTFIENNLVLASFIVCEVNFLRDNVIAADFCAALKSQVDSDICSKLDAVVLNGIKASITKLSSV